MLGIGLYLYDVGQTQHLRPVHCPQSALMSMSLEIRQVQHEICKAKLCLQLSIKIACSHLKLCTQLKAAVIVPTILLLHQ